MMISQVKQGFNKIQLSLPLSLSFYLSIYLYLCQCLSVFLSDSLNVHNPDRPKQSRVILKDIFSIKSAMISLKLRTFRLIRLGRVYRLVSEHQNTSQITFLLYEPIVKCSVVKEYEPIVKCSVKEYEPIVKCSVKEYEPGEVLSKGI